MQMRIRVGWPTPDEEPPVSVAKFDGTIMYDDDDEPDGYFAAPAWAVEVETAEDLLALLDEFEDESLALQVARDWTGHRELELVIAQASI